MTVDLELIATRVAKIREQLRHLARLDTLAREDFVASPVEQHAVERELQIVSLARRGLAILLVEQSVPFTLAVSDRVYLMEEGAVRHEGRAADLSRDHPVVRRYLGV